MVRVCNSMLQSTYSSAYKKLEVGEIDTEILLRGDYSNAMNCTPATTSYLYPNGQIGAPLFESFYPPIDTQQSILLNILPYKSR